MLNRMLKSKRSLLLAGLLTAGTLLGNADEAQALYYVSGQLTAGGINWTLHAYDEGRNVTEFDFDLGETDSVAPYLSYFGTSETGWNVGLYRQMVNGVFHTFAAGNAVDLSHGISNFASLDFRLNFASGFDGTTLYTTEWNGTVDGWLGFEGPDRVSVPGVRFDTIDIGNVVDTGNVAPVPEPGTMILLGTGLVGLFGVTRMRSRKRN
jgi:hypothetical protein